MTAQELREKFLKFFESKGHTIIPSASLIPKETDPSVLFTTAGMHPLVPYLLGEDHPGGKRVANVQKCIRTGDIDEVGDKIHHTFFEMLGNWSFGDYFKEEAIKWSWEFLTSKEWLNLDKNNLAVSVFAGDSDAPFDEEAFNIWLSLGISEKRIAKLPKENNWWGPAGVTGPCGPDTEMFYWSGEETAPEKFDPEDVRWVEIWNNVFMEYEKKARTLLIDGMHCLYDEEFNLNNDFLNKLKKYKTKKILVVNGFRDKAQELLKGTGIEAFSLEEEGIKKEDRKFFEKLASKYDLNLHESIYVDHDEKNIAGAKNAGIANTKLYTANSVDEVIEFINNSLYFFVPLKQKNVDTGMGFERTLAVLNGFDDNYQTELFKDIILKIEELSGKKYKDYQKEFRIISDHIKAAVFMISDGVTPLNVGRGYVLRRLIRRAIRYGRLIGVKNNFIVQIANIVIEVYGDFYKELKMNKSRIFEELENEENKFFELLRNVESRRNKRFFIIDRIRKRTKDEADKKWLENDSKIAKIDVISQWNKLEELDDIKKESLISNVSASAGFALETTYGYPHDMFFEDLKVKFGSKEWIDKATDVYLGLFIDHQKLSRTASAGMFKGGLADAGEATAKLHTATHLLLAAIREVLGGEIYQKGSNITAERLRFDFNYPQKLTPEQIEKIENLVNEKIRKNIPVEITEMTKDEALKIAKISFDPSKYGDVVKVYKIGDFSIEVCGGPHAKTTRELGVFKITKEEASSAGVRRIKAVLE